MRLNKFSNKLKNTIFKVVDRDTETKRQYKKWKYETREKFETFSPEIIKRYTNYYLGGYDLLETHQAIKKQK